MNKKKEKKTATSDMQCNVEEGGDCVVSYQHLIGGVCSEVLTKLSLAVWGSCWLVGPQCPCLLLHRPVKAVREWRRVVRMDSKAVQCSAVQGRASGYVRGFRGRGKAVQGRAGQGSAVQGSAM